MTTLPHRTTPEKWDKSENAFTIRRMVKARLEEDFIGTWAIGDAGPADLWDTQAGGGSGNEAATTVANSINGEVTLKSASNDVHNAFNTTMLTGVNLGYKANQGGLTMEARVKIDAITAVALFVGFTDTVAAVPVELPIYKAVDVHDTVDSDATDACGVCFDTDGATDRFFHAGVKNGTDTKAVHGGEDAVPVADTYFVIRVDVSEDGAVRGFLNGVPLGDWVENAVTDTVALTPCIAISNRGAAQRIATIDYIAVEQNR